MITHVIVTTAKTLCVRRRSTSIQCSLRSRPAQSLLVRFVRYAEIHIQNLLYNSRLYIYIYIYIYSVSIVVCRCEGKSFIVMVNIGAELLSPRISECIQLLKFCRGISNWLQIDRS